MLLGYLMLRSGLVPRRMAMFGIVGGPLVCASGIGVMFGAFEPGSTPQAIATIPEIIWEASLGDLPDRQGLQGERADPAPQRPGAGAAAA